MDNRYLLISLCMMFIISGCSEDGGVDYEIVGDSVQVNDSNIYIKATPHTLHSSDWVELEFESKLFSGDIDFAFGFDTDELKPIALEKWNPHEETIEKMYVCSYDFGYNATDFWCFSDDVNGTNTYFEHHYDRGNIQSKTAYWNETVQKNWSSWSIEGTTNFDFDGKNKWYYSTNRNINAGQIYKIRYFLSVTPDVHNAKYDLAIKPSSETIQQAINNDHFYFLDPWVDYSLDTGLMSYYTFDDDDHSNNNVMDMTDQGRNVTIVGGLTTGVEGILGETFLYVNDGAKHVNINTMETAPFIGNPTPGAGFSINVWVNITDLTSEEYIMGDANHNLIENGWSIRTSTGSTDLNYMAHHGASWPDIFATCTDCLTLDDWAMVTITKNATDIVFYKNGSYVSAKSDSDGPTEGAYDLLLGRDGFGNGPMSGKLDELGFWNRTITADEVAYLWNGGLGLEYKGEYTLNTTTIDTLQITPALAYVASETLNCSSYIWTDSGFNYNVTINWTNSTDFISQDIQEDKLNGTYSSFNLTGHDMVLGEVLNCTMFAHETDNQSINITSSTTRTILDTIPVWTNARNNITVNHTTNITLDYDCVDPDGPVTFSIRNLTTDMLIAINSVNGNISHDPNVTNTGKHDYNVTCQQGTTNATQILNVTILNNAPTIPTIISPAGNLSIFSTSINLSCDGSTDIDNDLLYYEFWGNTSTDFFDLLQNTTNINYTWSSLIPGAEYNWNCRATDTINSSAFTLNRTIYLVNFTNCTGENNIALNFTYKDEENSTALTETFKANFQMVTQDGDTSEALFDLGASTNHRLCLANGNQSITINTGMIEYVLGAYDARNYYFYDATIQQNDTSNIVLYSLPQTLASGISITVTDESGAGLEEHLVYVERYNVETNTYKLIAMGKTGDDGKDTIFLRGGTTSTGDAWYRFKIYYEGELLETTLPQKIIAATLSVPVGLTEYQEHIDTINDVGHTLTYNESTRTFLTTFSTDTGLPRNFCFKVVEERPGKYIYEKYDQCLNSASGALSYTHDATPFTYHAYVYSFASSKDLLQVMTIASLTNNLGETGVFISALLIIILVTVGTFSPIAAVIFGTLGIIGSNIMGLITVSQATITAIVALALIIIVKLGRRR